MCSKTRRIWFFAVCAGEVEKAASPVVSWVGSRGRGGAAGGHSPPARPGPQALAGHAGAQPQRRRPPPGPGCPPYEKGTRARPEKSFRRAIYRRVPESR